MIHQRINTDYGFKDVTRCDINENILELVSCFGCLKSSSEISTISNAICLNGDELLTCKDRAVASLMFDIITEDLDAETIDWLQRQNIKRD